MLIYILSYRKFPPMKWAQRAECVLITIEVADCEDVKIDLNEEDSKLTFR